MYTLKGEDLTRRQRLKKGVATGEVFTFLFFQSLGQAFSKACGVQGQCPASPVALRRGRNPLNGIFFLLSFFFCAFYRQKKKRQTISDDERPVLYNNKCGTKRCRICCNIPYSVFQNIPPDSGTAPYPFRSASLFSSQDRRDSVLSTL